MGRSEEVDLGAKQRRVLLVIAGGIAAYKALEVIRLLTKAGIATRAVMTEAAKQFVTPLSVGALTGDVVYDHLFDLTAENDMGHIELSRSADLIVVLPATANVMAKMAHGMADDLASTVLLATDKPIVIAPAMNVRMWLHPATQRNLSTLRGDGVRVISPDEGEMACGEFGPGRLAAPEVIVSEIEATLAGQITPRISTAGMPLAGRHLVVTSGPTYEPIDPVRYLANRSSGKQGHAIAAAALAAGARVTLISGPVDLAPPSGAELIQVETAQDMLQATLAALPADAAIMAAAVADWRVDQAAQTKLKKSDEGTPRLHLIENPDILKTIAALDGEPPRPSLVVGFAAETNDVMTHATAKLERKGCDWIVANDVSMTSEIEGGVMGADDNQVSLISAAGVDAWPTMPKAKVAEKLVAEIAKTLGPQP